MYRNLGNLPNLDGNNADFGVTGSPQMRARR